MYEDRRVVPATPVGQLLREQRGHLQAGCETQDPQKSASGEDVPVAMAGQVPLVLALPSHVSTPLVPSVLLCASHPGERGQ